jgi:hypothetical protein
MNILHDCEYANEFMFAFYRISFYYKIRITVISVIRKHATSRCHDRAETFKIFSMETEPLGGLGLLIVEASRSHSDTPHSVGLLWTSDQPVAMTFTW